MASNYLYSHGVTTVSAKPDPTFRPGAGQARLARLANTFEYYYFPGDTITGVWNTLNLDFDANYNHASILATAGNNPTDISLVIQDILNALYGVMGIALDGNESVLVRAVAFPDPAPNGTAPTGGEVANPINGDTATIHYNNNIFSRWVYASNTWNFITSINYNDYLSTVSDSTTINFTVTGSDLTGVVISDPTGGTNAFYPVSGGSGVKVVSAALPTYDSHQLAIDGGLLDVGDYYCLTITNIEGVASNGRGPIFRYTGII